LFPTSGGTKTTPEAKLMRTDGRWKGQNHHHRRRHQERRQRSHQDQLSLDNHVKGGGVGMVRAQREEWDTMADGGSTDRVIKKSFEIDRKVNKVIYKE